MIRSIKKHTSLYSFAVFTSIILLSVGVVGFLLFFKYRRQPTAPSLPVSIKTVPESSVSVKTVPVSSPNYIPGRVLSNGEQLVRLMSPNDRKIFADALRKLRGIGGQPAVDQAVSWYRDGVMDALDGLTIMYQQDTAKKMHRDAVARAVKTGIVTMMQAVRILPLCGFSGNIDDDAMKILRGNDYAGQNRTIAQMINDAAGANRSLELILIKNGSDIADIIEYLSQ